VVDCALAPKLCLHTSRSLVWKDIVVQLHLFALLDETSVNNVKSAIFYLSVAR
jgi:hypothetical protein